jgi:hypothetical protein
VSRPSFPPSTPNNRRPQIQPIQPGSTGQQFQGGGGGGGGVGFPGSFGQGSNSGGRLQQQQQTSVGCTDFNGQAGQCLPAVSCSQFFQSISNNANSAPCQLSNGLVGVCCPAQGFSSAPGILLMVDHVGTIK